MTVGLDGRLVPAVGVMHQTAHASAAFFQSHFERAAVFSHDNGDPVRRDGHYKGGMLYYGEGSRLLPIWTAPVAAGLIYSRSAEAIGLGQFAGPGKMMGLSGYGRPAFLDRRFIGDTDALSELYANRSRVPAWGWFNAVEQEAKRLGYAFDGGPLGPFGRDLAATAQKCFEELVLYVTERAGALLAKTGRATADLCLSGGCALNCPTNSRIVEETGFRNVFVPPSCDDGGLSIGAALYLHHHVLGHPRCEAPPPGASIAALGRTPSPAALAAALDAAAHEFAVERDVALPARAAEDLAAGRVVALYQGRSESGPRALGQRSLLADPRPAENWPRVNELKSRERWRPFAPACLAERLRDHFDGGPEQSPHMLFNYRVRDRSLAAVTHVDGTARVQTVAPGSGPFRDIIEAFDRRTGVPVILNTSLNGPGEPIVETPGQALDFLRRTRTDVLYLGANRVSRPTA